MVKKIRIAWWGKHFGEEPPLVGSLDQGAGAVFFSCCNLHCIFCQNYQISQERLGKEYDPAQLAEIFLALEADNAVTIDLVSPTIWSKQIVLAINLARRQGLSIPIVWNSNGYEPVELLKRMNGLIDVYLPDCKYGIDEIGRKYSKASDYPRKAEAAISEMLRQVGHFQSDDEGVVAKGLIVRHLVLPGNLANTKAVLDLLASIDPDLTISLMNQYLPLYLASSQTELTRKLNEEEWLAVLDYLDRGPLNNGWVQLFDSAEDFVPDFRLARPFDR